MTEIRYCKHCKENILHDRTTDDSRDPSGAPRIFFGIFTLGFSELCRDCVWKCQKCGEETYIR